MALSSVNRNIKIAVEGIKDKNGKQIINKHVTTHTLRHSHISLLSQLGVSQVVPLPYKSHIESFFSMIVATPFINKNIIKFLRSKFNIRWGCIFYKVGDYCIIENDYQLNSLSRRK